MPLMPIVYHCLILFYSHYVNNGMIRNREQVLEMDNIWHLTRCCSRPSHSLSRQPLRYNVLIINVFCYGSHQNAAPPGQHRLFEPSCGNLGSRIFRSIFCRVHPCPLLQLFEYFVPNILSLTGPSCLSQLRPSSNGELITIRSLLAQELWGSPIHLPGEYIQQLMIVLYLEQSCATSLHTSVTIRLLIHFYTCQFCQLVC